MPDPNTQPTAFKVLIADDHTLIVASVKELVSKCYNSAEIRTAQDGITAIALASEFKPDLLILDLGLPRASGIEILGEVRRWSKDTRVLVLTGLTSAAMLQSALDAGAHGISLKTSPLDTLVDGIGAVLKGENWIGADAAQILEAGESQGQLTSREAQILNMIAQGMTNAEIGKRLGISPKTVDNHRTRLMGKLGVNSRAQLLAVALKTGLLGLHLQL